jgi:tetratricopeptide (TPR) repeat protein
MQSVSIYPTWRNYDTLALALVNMRDYTGAEKAYYLSLKYNNSGSTYEGLGEIIAARGRLSDKQFLLSAIGRFPEDFTLWMFLAILEDRYNDNADAKAAISRAVTLGQVPQPLYNAIMSNHPFTFNIQGLGSTTIPGSNSN